MSLIQGYLKKYPFGVSAFQNVKRQILHFSLTILLVFRAGALTVRVPEYLFKDVCIREESLSAKQRADMLPAHYKRFRLSWFKVLLLLWLFPLL